MDFETMMQAKNQRSRISTTKNRISPDKLTPVQNKVILKTKSTIHANTLDWTRQLFSQYANEGKKVQKQEKVIRSPE